MKYALTLLTALSIISCQAQTMKVTYSEKLDLAEKLESIDNPMIKQMVLEKAGSPKYYELISHKGVSIYQKQNVEEERIDNGVTMIGAGGEDITYKNHNSNSYVKQTNFMSRNFLIQDVLPKHNWEITNETEKIGDYTCKKALLKREAKKDIVVWFTAEVPSNEGPKDYYGLPGLILKVKTGTTIIEASNIELSNENVTITVPTEGKKVSQAEFDKIRDEKIDALSGGKQSGNGVKVIRM